MRAQQYCPEAEHECARRRRRPQDKGVVNIDEREALAAELGTNRTTKSADPRSLGVSSEQVIAPMVLPFHQLQRFRKADSGHHSRRWSLRSIPANLPALQTRQTCAEPREIEDRRKTTSAATEACELRSSELDLKAPECAWQLQLQEMIDSIACVGGTAPHISGDGDGCADLLHCGPEQLVYPTRRALYPFI